MTRTLHDAIGTVKGLFPPGDDTLYAWEDRNDWTARDLSEKARLLLCIQQAIDALRIELNPATASQKLPDWETTLALGASRIAVLGSQAQRQAQIVARLRESGASTLANIEAALRAVVGPVPGALTIIEHSRAAIDEANVYSASAKVVAALGTTSWSWTGADNAVASRAGARVRLWVPASNTVVGTFTLAAGALTAVVPVFFFGGGSGDWLYLYAPTFAGGVIDGTPITLTFVESGNVGCTLGGVHGGVTSGLIWEGIGVDLATGAQGRGALVFEWSAVINEALVLASTYSRELVMQIVRRWNPAHANGGVALVQADGTLCALCDDPNALADLAVAC